MKTILTAALLATATFGQEERLDDVYRPSMEVMAIKEAIWENANIPEAETIGSVKGLRNGKILCENGFVRAGGESYPCDKVNFYSMIGRGELKRERRDFRDRTYRMSDIWGWKSPDTGREYTLSCMTNVMWFIDSTDPLNPRPLGWLESHRAESSWCDTKVYKNVAYIVQDRSTSGGNDRGIQVFDLKRLESSSVQNSPEPVQFDVDYTYTRHGAVHNVLIDNDSGYLYCVGTSGGESCRGGLHMVDLSNPLRPEFAGCADSDGYTHDAQCIVYSGPDVEHRGKQICFAFNEDTLTIWDVTNKQNPRILSRRGYPTARYTHQGWVSPDQDFVVMNDELDEQRGSVGNTRSYIINVEDLDNPFFSGYYDHGVTSIDHNLYFFGDIHRRGWGGSPAMADHPSLKYFYCSNYVSGLRVIDATNIKDSNPQLRTAGFFDVSPRETGNTFLGAWSAYLHPSGVIAVNTIETGVFFLEFEDAFDESSSRPGSPSADDESKTSEGTDGYAVAFWSLFVAAVAFAAFFGVKTLRNRSGKTEEAESGEVPPPARRESKKAAQGQSHIDNPMFTEKL